MMFTFISMTGLLAGFLGLIVIAPAVANTKAVATTAEGSIAQNSSATQPEEKATELNKTIARLIPVFYVIDEKLDRDLRLENLTMGIAKPGETVEIVEDRESMIKVRFEATERIGWVSPRAFEAL